MNILPPGNILQYLYLKKRLKLFKDKLFLEIGSGNGYLSHELLSIGLNGIGCDLNENACINNENLNRLFIQRNGYKVIQGDFIMQSFNQKFDLIISSMVIEHLDEAQLTEFIEKIKLNLNQNGLIIFLVPSSMKYWGIEDEIAGHFKRYEFDDFKVLSDKHNLKINHLVGLTYPISNWLYQLSNKLIRKSESSKLGLSQREKTIYTGNREVPYKTSFPSIFKIILNEYCLYPFHLLQMLFSKSDKSLVIYCELKNNTKK